MDASLEAEELAESIEPNMVYQSPPCASHESQLLRIHHAAHYRSRPSPDVFGESLCIEDVRRSLSAVRALVDCGRLLVWGMANRKLTKSSRAAWYLIGTASGVAVWMACVLGSSAASKGRYVNAAETLAYESGMETINSLDWQNWISPTSIWIPQLVLMMEREHFTSVSVSGGNSMSRRA